MNSFRITLFLLIFALLVTMFAGCAQADQQQGTAGRSGVAGFWSGLWQGLILPVAFIISLFRSDTGIYEIHNDGNLYNLGFVLGTWLTFGVIMASSRRRR